jgi:ABC-type Fe3+ transport system permease subunit
MFVGLAMVSSAFLFWQERRAIRQESRAARRESREISVDENEEWTPRAWLYATAFGLSFFLSWYLLPALFFSS